MKESPVGELHSQHVPNRLASPAELDVSFCPEVCYARKTAEGGEIADLTYPLPLEGGG